MKKSLVFSGAVIIVLLITALGSCSGGGATTSQSVSYGTPTTIPTTPVTTTTTTPPATNLSEQPDTATYHKYFSELGIGWMPIDVKDPPSELKKNVSVFQTTDQICFYGTILIDCQPVAALYDVVNKKVMRQENLLPSAMSGGFANWEPLDLPVGQYECKVYVNNVLVSVLPFTVH